MPIETFSLINSLNASNPIHTDNLGEADSHLRGIKQTLLNTFPGIAGTVVASDVSLNAAGKAFLTPGTVDVAPSGTIASAALRLEGVTAGTDVFAVNTGTIAGAPGLAIKMTQGTTTTTPLTLNQGGTLAPFGALDAPSVRKAGNELLPAGVICMWSGSVTAIPAGWALCDGTNGTPNLENAFIVGAGGLYGVGSIGGATAATATTSSAGSHAHGGATAAAGSFSVSTATDVQGAHSHGGSDQGHALTIAEIPSHDHGLGGTTVLTAGGSPGGGGGNYVADVAFATQGGGQAHSHGISLDGAHSHNLTVSAGNHQHTISTDGVHTHSVTVATLPPYYALAFIMKL